MKLIILMMMTLSLSINAKDYCAKELLVDAFPDNTERLLNAGGSFNQMRIDAWDKYFEYSISQQCMYMMSTGTFKGPSGKVYISVYTNDDECDGGNIMGLVFDLDNNIVIEISDGENYCPEGTNIVKLRKGLI